MATTRALDQLAEEKEQELLHIRQQQAQAAQESLKGTQNELLLERQCRSQLQADFDYNLSLLSQRDEELSRYENAFTELKKVVNNLLAENSELKVRVDGLHTEIEQGRLSQQQLKAHYVKRIEDLHTQTEAYRRATQSEVERERTKLEQLQRKLEQRLLEVEGDIQCQRDRVAAEFDQLSRQNEHEHQMKVSELNSQLLSKETQLKQLEREMRAAQCAKASSEEQAKDKESEVSRMEREVREMQWRMEDTSNLLESRVAELTAQLEQTQAVARSHQEDFQKRHEELDRRVREKETCIKAAKEACNKREVEMEQTLAEVRAQVEAKESEIRRLLWEHDDSIKEKDLQIQRCQEDLVSCQCSSDERVRRMSQDLVARDLKLQTFEDMCERLREDVKKRDADIERFKQEVGAGLVRERSLEQSKAQLQLDWERRMEEVERQAYGKHQHIIQQLTEAKDKLSLECEEVKSALDEQTAQFMAVQQERDIAITTLNKHGLAGHVTTHVTDHVTQLQQLRQQNEELHGVIRQMRQELEQLAHSSETLNITKKHANPEQDRNVVPTIGYVQYMENELVKLKSENRQLMERLQLTPPTGKPPTPSPSNGRRSPSPPRNSNSSGGGERRQHRSHLIALSDTIASLQKEKGGLELSVVQLKSKVEELETNLSKEQEQVYLLKACQVPQSKLHLKLLQATKVIIALVNEKKLLTAQLKEMADGYDRKMASSSGNQSGKSNTTAVIPPPVEQSEKSVQTSRKSPRSQVQWTTEQHLESSMEQISPVTQTERLYSGLGRRTTNTSEEQSRRCHEQDQVQVYIHRKSSPKIINQPRSSHEEDHSSRHDQAMTQQQEEQQLDMSLASLKFTDSSLGENSLRHVLQMVERELSSSDNDRDVPIRHSTPEPPLVESHRTTTHLQSPQRKRENESLKLIGNKVVPQEKRQVHVRGRSQAVDETIRSRTKNRLSSAKPRVRNYNVRD